MIIYLPWLGEDCNHTHSGYLENFTPITESDPDEWWYMWTVNIRGPYLVTRSFLPLLLKGDDKQIVNQSSVGAHATRRGASACQTSKIANLRFTEFIMSEYGEEGGSGVRGIPRWCNDGDGSPDAELYAQLSVDCSLLLRTRPPLLTI